MNKQDTWSLHVTIHQTYKDVRCCFKETSSDIYAILLMYSNSYDQEHHIDWVTCCHGLDLLMEYFRSNTKARFEMPQWCAGVYKILTLNWYLHLYMISISSHISTRGPRARFSSDNHILFSVGHCTKWRWCKLWIYRVSINLETYIVYVTIIRKA